MAVGAENLRLIELDYKRDWGGKQENRISVSSKLAGLHVYRTGTASEFSKLPGKAG